MPPRRRLHHAATAEQQPAQAWTADRIRALGATTDLVTAASVLGIPTSTVYKLARRGELPVPTFRVGVRYRVPTAAILATLYLDPPSSEPADGASPTAPPPSPGPPAA